MAQYAQGLTEFEKRVVAVYVGGRPLGAAASGDASQMKNRCESHPPFEPSRGVRRGTDGDIDSGNSRFQPSPGLTAADAPKLTLKWAFGFPNGNSAYGQPTVVGGRVFVGADTGFVYALDAASGCIHWSFRANAGVRTAISIGPGTRAHRYPRLLRRREGQRVRRRRARPARRSGEIGPTRIRSRASPARRRWSDGRLYVPIVVARGVGRRQPELSVLHVPRRRRRLRRRHAANACGRRTRSRKRPWPLKKTSKGTQLWGPAGAGVWSSPTDRSEAPRGVCRDRQWVHRAGGARLGRRDRVRSRQRQATVDEAGDGQRRVRARLPRQVSSAGADGQQVRDVPGRSGPGHGLRQRADSAHAGRTDAR